MGTKATAGIGADPLERLRRGWQSRTTAFLAFAAGALVVVWMGADAGALAVPTVPLGTAEAFSVLGGQSVTNTGPSLVGDDLGTSPGSSVTGFPPGLVNGVQHVADGVASQAQADASTAYGNAAGRVADSVLVTPELAGLTLLPGVHESLGHSFLELNGSVTLDGQGDLGSVFILQSASTLTTGAGSVVQLVNGAQACNVFWQVASSATLGTNSTFAGTILALTSVSVTTGATVEGRAMAANGSVTLDTNTFTSGTCAAAPPVTTTTAATTVVPTTVEATTTTAPPGPTTSSPTPPTTPPTTPPATPPATTSAPVTGPPPQTAPPTTSRATATPTLPRTGASTSALLAVATAALAVGSVLVLLGRRGIGQR